jgi:hypothetical protein
MAEAENASIAPDERKAERQDRENHIQRDLQQGVQIEHEGQTDQQQDANGADENETGI